MDQLQSARRKREQYIGPWLPEPLLTEETSDAANPEKRVEIEESISLAFLVLLEQLQPFERVVFLLREVFAYEFAEMVVMLEKSEAACRRSFSRAKQHLVSRRPRFPQAPEMHRQLLTGFLAAVQSGEMSALTDLLSENVMLWADGGGKIKQAALRRFTAVMRWHALAWAPGVFGRRTLVSSGSKSMARMPCLSVRTDMPSRS